MFGIFHGQSEKQKLLHERKFKELGNLLDEEYKEAIRKASDLSYLRGLIYGLTLDTYEQLQAFKRAAELNPENEEYRKALKKAQDYWDSLDPESTKRTDFFDL